MYVCNVCTCVRMYVFMCMHVFPYVCACTSIYICISVCAYESMYAIGCAYTRMYIYLYVCTYTEPLPTSKLERVRRCLLTWKDLVMISLFLQTCDEIV
jgi:hypothetical protein